MRPMIGIATLVATIAAAGSAAADVTFPVRSADRPASLPQNAVRAEVDVGVSRDEMGMLSWDSVLTGGYGITTELEVGGQLLPVDLYPSAGIGQPLAYVSYVVVPGPWSVMPTVQVSIPVRAAHRWSLQALLTISGVLDDCIIITTVPSFSVGFDDSAVVSAALPIQAGVQLNPRTVFNMQTGIALARFDLRQETAPAGETEINQVTIPLGAGVLYTVGVDDSPFVDLGLEFQWPALYQARRSGDGVSTKQWDVVLSIATYVSL